MQLHVIGSGCPVACPERYGSAFVLDVAGGLTLVDCGPATTWKIARAGLRPTHVQHVFFTHHHYDHNADFPCFALTRWDESKGTEPPLEVFGPPPTEAFVEALLGERGAFAIDWKSRIEHPASHACHRQRGGVMPRPAPAMRVRDVGPGRVAETPSWPARAVRVHHVEPTMISLAYRFDTDEGSVVFAGDCGDCPELRELASGADTLVLACTHFGSLEMDRAITDVITGTREVASIAEQSGTRRVVLTHMSPGFERPGMRERAVAEVARSFGGEILCPDEHATVSLSDQ
jgi:ribonuclease BN (tRNA processing enzyme)